MEARPYLGRVFFICLVLVTYLSGQTVNGNTTIRVNVNLVSFPVTVTDSSGGFVAGLRREDFRVYEDGVPQSVAVFRDEVAPVSVGIVIDTSGSMKPKLPYAVSALEHFVNTIQPEDDVFLIRFATRVVLSLDSTADRELFSDAAHGLRALGSTHLYDALDRALEKVAGGRYPRKAIILITDGKDTSSRVPFNELLDHARGSEVLIYCLGIGARAVEKSESPHRVVRGFIVRRSGEPDTVDMGVLEQLADATGARAFFLRSHGRDAGNIDEAAQQISAELRHQYTIGYYCTLTARDGRYRRIRVEATKPGVAVRHRLGYYARPS